MHHHSLFKSEYGKWQLIFMVKCSFNKQQFYLLWVYNRLTSAGTLMHMLYYGGFDLNENYILVISNSNSNKESMTKCLSVKMFRGGY